MEGTSVVKRLRRWFWSMLPLLTGCGSSKYLLSEVPKEPFDAVIVPGCPSNEDGSLTRCQLGRAGWAAWLYQQGAARYLVPSGSAVHSPYVEAEAMAAAMAVLGVPPDRIILESHALHTDENMWNSLRIVRHLGWKRIAVASNDFHAVAGCRMLEDWQQPCSAFALDIDTLQKFLPEHEPKLNALRARRVPDWQDMSAQEEARSKVHGRTRPPSFLLYPAMAWLRFIGQPWIPFGCKENEIVTWADVLQATEPSKL